MIRNLVLLVTIFISSLYSFNVGDTPKNIILEGKNGSLVSGGEWNSNTIKNKIYTLFYVDPDEKDTNEEFARVLKLQKFDKTKFGTIAIINLKATWKPNFIIETLLKAKQKKYPHTTYVKDKKSVLVKQWGLKNDSSEIVVFDRNAKVIYYHSGRLDKNEINKAIKVIKDHI